MVAASLDLKAGQAIDRAGVMLGLPFPAGARLDELSLQSTRQFRVRPTMRECNCSLSGIENQCKKMLANGDTAADIAAYCIQAVCAALEGMTDALLQEYGALPIVFAGGVTANRYIRARLSKKYSAHFADPVALEQIKADAGIDIGLTLIGMHLKQVAVPVRLENNKIGQAIVVAARTRPKFIGGVRAIYNEDLL